MKQLTLKVKNHLTDVKFSDFFNSNNVKAMLLLVAILIPFTSFGQNSDVSNDIQGLYDNEIKPVMNVLVGVVVGICAIWAGIQFFMGKREALKTFGYVLLGALVIRFLPDLVLTFMGQS